MMRRCARSARRNLVKERGKEIVAPLQMADRAAQLETRPGLCLDREHIDRKVFINRDALTLGPVQIGFQHKLADLIPERGLGPIARTIHSSRRLPFA